MSMKKFFINHTNHPSDHWNAAQISAAKIYGEIVDFPFPAINPTATTEQIHNLAAEIAEKILAHAPAAVLCQGEFNYTFAITNLLKKSGVTVVAATTERVVTTEILSDGSSRQVSTFRFVQFREY